MIALIALLACGGAHKLPTATLDVGGHAVTAEVAANPGDRANGLMYREHLDDTEGMLFIYPGSEPRSFWMKNVPIPLSIAFLDERGTIVKIAEMQAQDESRTQSLYPAKYALEMAAGWYDRNHVEVGVTIGGIPTDLKVE